ncbi:MAG: UDP-N-acetylglucosamine--N-acetylmuramyl-(pentapeptide) pyrophosphoryl-undecaprenol N-acetylglucosamine transferase [Candidatus Paceibacteria bacterium]|jgi:UDP-N-acetylglucosamine--N-acetylmuramyl-(pentapeptide) pyrophosphoryl-undecaprenol N-acetylglucosamine transferase
MRLAFAGGGTGGHIVPGIHLLEQLAEDPTGEPRLEDLLWFTSGRPVEDLVLEGVNPPAPWERLIFELEPRAGGAPGFGRLMTKTPAAVLRARRALKRHRTQVLLGLGGFTTLPAVLAARSLGIPVALLEINAAQGKATRLMARFADRVFHAWRGTLPGRPSATRDLQVGAPVSPAVRAVGKSSGARSKALAGLGLDPSKPLLLVLGGSQGAGSLNGFIAEYAGTLLKSGLQILHQCGPKRSAELPSALPGLHVSEYISPMATALEAASLVLCRGGASTLSEIAAASRAAVVVPYPHHADQHQELNARELGKGVRIVPDEGLNLDLALELARMAGSAGAPERAAMELVLSKLGLGNAATRILQELNLLARVAGASSPAKFSQ